MPATPPSSSKAPSRSAVTVVLGALVFMGLSAWGAWPAWEQAFRSDASPVSWLSSALLLTLAVVALRLRAEAALPPGLGAWLALGFALLALDEQFMWHELWKYRCHELTAWCELEAVRELPMRLVALFGALTVACLCRVMRSWLSRGLLLAGLACGLWALSLDQMPMPYPLSALEEGFEVLAESLVLAALLSLPSGKR